MYIDTYFYEKNNNACISSGTILWHRAQKSYFYHSIISMKIQLGTARATDISTIWVNCTLMRSGSEYTSDAWTKTEPMKLYNIRKRVTVILIRKILSLDRKINIIVEALIQASCLAITVTSRDTLPNTPSHPLEQIYFNIVWFMASKSDAVNLPGAIIVRTDKNKSAISVSIKHTIKHIGYLITLTYVIILAHQLQTTEHFYYLQLKCSKTQWILQLNPVKISTITPAGITRIWNGLQYHLILIYIHLIVFVMNQ